MQVPVKFRLLVEFRDQKAVIVLQLTCVEIDILLHLYLGSLQLTWLTGFFVEKFVWDFSECPFVIRGFQTNCLLAALCIFSFTKHVCWLDAQLLTHWIKHLSLKITYRVLTRLRRKSLQQSHIYFGLGPQSNCIRSSGGLTCAVFASTSFYFPQNPSKKQKQNNYPHWEGRVVLSRCTTHSETSHGTFWYYAWKALLGG